MLTKIQQKRNQVKREKNNARRKQRQASLHAEYVWRKSGKGRAVLAERDKEELEQVTPVVVEKIKEATK